MQISITRENGAMHRIPRGVSRLAGLIAFCAAVLLALLMDVHPLTALWRGACCAVSFALVAWLSAQVVLSVLRAGSERHNDDAEA